MMCGKDGGRDKVHPRRKPVVAGKTQYIRNTEYIRTSVMVRPQPASGQIHYSSKHARKPGSSQILPPSGQ